MGDHDQPDRSPIDLDREHRLILVTGCFQEMPHACDTCSVMQSNDPWDGGANWVHLRIQLEYSEKVDLSVKELLENGPVAFPTDISRPRRRRYGPGRACRSPLKRTSARLFFSLSTVKRAETSRVRNCSFVRAAVSLPALSTGKHVTLSHWVFQTLLSYIGKDRNMIFVRIDWSTHVYGWQTSWNAKKTSC